LRAIISPHFIFACRELKEELTIDVAEEDSGLIDKCLAPAANSPEVNVHMKIFLVKKWQGEIASAREVEQIRWLTLQAPKGLKIGSIMQHGAMPKLKATNLID
jgi:8-oxo-dGTP pyrophosphatase MutT (NUDIX family)